MRVIVYSIILAFNMNIASGQIIYLQTGKSYTTFDYKTSSGGRLDNLNGALHTNLELGTRLPLFGTSFHFSGEAHLQEYGVSGSDIDLGNSYKWAFANAGLNAGLDYEFFTPAHSVRTQYQEGFSFYLKASFAVEYTITGTQTINNTVNNLFGEEEFDKPFYFFKGGAGVNYYFSRDYYASLNYMWGKSFLIGDYLNQEQLKLITHNISIGMSINLQYNK